MSRPRPHTRAVLPVGHLEDWELDALVDFLAHHSKGVSAGQAAQHVRGLYRRKAAEVRAALERLVDDGVLISFDVSPRRGWNEIGSRIPVRLYFLKGSEDQT